MIAAGVKDKIDCFALVKGPGRRRMSDIRYLDTTTNEYRLAKFDLGDPEWYDTWGAFLPVLRNHLKEKGWFERATLSFDEKPEKYMRLIFDFLIKHAKDFKISIAGGGHYPGDKRKWADEISLYYDILTDEAEWEQMKPLVKRMKADPGRYVTFYTACEPPLPNCFLYSPLRESRLLPWLAWKYGLDGYLRWASNAFPEEVWEQPNYKWHSGDMYFVYPGPDGPLDGMRWELMRQGIQDYEALRIAQESAEAAGRADLIKTLNEAVRTGTVISDCHRVPRVGEARAIVNEVIRELGG
ncbi:DUF4091 domain-containing protein [candidate division KSB1 bacterium]